MATSPASAPMVMDGGTKGLNQSMHNPAAGASQFNAPTPADPDPPPHMTPEAPGAQKIREMKEWKSLSALIERNAIEIAIRDAARTFLQSICPQETLEPGT